MCTRLSFVAVLLVLMAGRAVAASEPARVLVAHPRGDAPIDVDGRLDEAAWRAAPVGDAFVERVPVPRARPPVDSEVRVLFDDEAIYVGVRMALMEGETPRGLELTRDNPRMWSDDALTLKFDVRRDHRTTMGIVVNAAGAQLDYVALDNGRQFRLEYDAVWTSAVEIADGFWTAELRIPAPALGLPAMNETRAIGFNATRDHNARLATDDWTHLPPEFGSQSALHYGELRGLRGIGGGQPVALMPFVLGAYERVAGAEDGEVRVGGDARLRIGDDVWTELTVLTDFAQVDLDDPVVNFDRFQLFLPEKRPFFLTGLDVFEFGEPQRVQLFYSRRIGLDRDGEPIDLFAGMKAYGRAGPVAFGALDAITDSAPGTPSTHWATGRLRADLSRDVSLGVIGVARHPFETASGADAVSGEPHYAAGADATVRGLDRRLELGAFGAFTSSVAEARRIEGAASRVTLRWHGESFRPTLQLLHVSDDFEPEAGFVRRSGIVQPDFSLSWEERTPTWGLEAWRVAASGDVLADDEFDARLGADAETTFELDWRNGWVLEIGTGWREDQVETAFDFVDRVPIEPDRYDWPRVTASVSSPEGRNPNGAVVYTHEFGRFGAEADSVETSGTLSLTRHVKLGGAVDWSSFDFPGRAAFEVLTLSGRLTIAPTTHLSTDLIGQYNSASEASRSVVRLRWRYLPGSDLFLVYSYRESEQHRAVAKLVYRYDALL